MRRAAAAPHTLKRTWVQRGGLGQTLELTAHGLVLRRGHHTAERLQQTMCAGGHTHSCGQRCHTPAAPRQGQRAAAAAGPAGAVWQAGLLVARTGAAALAFLALWGCASQLAAAACGRALRSTQGARMLASAGKPGLAAQRPCACLRKQCQARAEGDGGAWCGVQVGSPVVERAWETLCGSIVQEVRRPLPQWRARRHCQGVSCMPGHALPVPTKALRHGSRRPDWRRKADHPMALLAPECVDQEVLRVPAAQAEAVTHAG